MCKTLILQKMVTEIGILNKTSKWQWYRRSWQTDAAIKIQKCRFFPRKIIVNQRFSGPGVEYP